MLEGTCGEGLLDIRRHVALSPWENGVGFAPPSVLKKPHTDRRSQEAMVCGCSKKQGANAAAMVAAEHIGDPAEWGPFLWKYLHVLAEQIGRSGNTIVDTDQAQYMEAMVSTLPQVIPCMECQAHATTYLATHPIPPLKGLYGADLRARIRTWLFEFHQAVRIQKGQPIIVTAEDCEGLYANQHIPMGLFKVWRRRFDRDG